MFKDMTIGQYLPTDSIIHKLDPRIKIGIIGLFMVAVFLVNSIYLYIPIFLGLILVMIAAKISPSYVIKGIKPLRFIIILTFLINALVTPGEVLAQFWIFTLTKEGLLRASFMAIRLILLVMGTSMLTLTTSPIELTDGLESLFNPLKRFGFPAHELAMMMTIALRFIPTLIEESDKIMKAQMARGADFESGNLIDRAKNLVPLLVPLFINSLRRADELATAMEARCYRGGEGRTRLNELKTTGKDYVALVIVILYLGATIAVGRIYQFQI
ncbi:energy-coupling factor transporter transmembrane component T family protein [Microaceticoccus formicicus]|uniref:energy-coupling factor transporter transmembrane component T family protein n=1 Tax=Microaceticoccus formicicus TaxID=3118105 RepID=UPI003CD0299B|nr:energy-coupling factor transporter transmembrane component T [Peptoniphilaceae bacterium AMB_02]